MNKSLLIGTLGSLALIISIMLLGYWIGSQEKSEPLKPTYSIYEYPYENTYILRYRDNLMIYEYSYAGLHLLQVVNGAIIQFSSKEDALEFSRTYLGDIKNEDRL